MRKTFGTLCMLSCLAAGVGAQTIDVQSDTWVCKDGLNRVVASSDRGVTRTKIDTTCQIGMFYYIWHGQHGAEIKDITRLLEADPENPAWGGYGQFHWGSKPALGYYTAGDRFVIAKHMQWLMDAGINFYFFDVTNAYTYDSQVQAVMDEIDRREKLGLRTPKLVFCCASGTDNVVTHLYNLWYSKPANDKYWFYWNGKPVILANSGLFQNVSENIRNHFTMRHSWAWQEGEDMWPWLAYYPQQLNYSKETGKKVNEQMTVATAMHPTSRTGKSYHDGAEPYVDKYGLTNRTPYGDFFAEQFSQAISKHPKVLMITQWNEWMAQRFIVDAGTLSLTRPGATQKVGETYFVDVYNQEFNRDIEPSSESLIRDNYYMQLVSNVRKYRGVHTIPVPTVTKTIDMEGDFTQWDDVDAEYLDEPGDTYYTSETAQNAISLKRKSNDIVRMKVTKDASRFYFYAEVNGTTFALPTSSKNPETWMNLLLNTDMVYTNGWEGYDYKVARSADKYYLYSWDSSSKEWKEDKEVDMKKEGNKLMYAIDRADIGLTADTDFDFKWIDNTPAASTEILDFLANGDVAPTGRFNYRYKGSKLETATAIHGVKETISRHGVQIFDLSGRKVTTIQNGIAEDDLTDINLPTGTYIAQFGRGSHAKSVKFAVE